MKTKLLLHACMFSQDIHLLLSFTTRSRLNLLPSNLHSAQGMESGKRKVLENQIFSFGNLCAKVGISGSDNNLHPRVNIWMAAFNKSPLKCQAKPWGWVRSP